MKPSDRYMKIVEWSDEDRCYIGRCPGLMLGGIHGRDENKVYRELCQVVEEWIEIHKNEGLPLPPRTSGKRHSGRFVLRVGPSLHERLSIRAATEGTSLNEYCKDVLDKAVA